MVHMHLTSIVIAIILFFVSASMQTGSKGQKVTHMILRVFYILILITGGMVFSTAMAGNMAMQYGIKLVGGLLVIGMMEMVLVSKEKGKSNGVLWTLLIVFLVFTIYMGFHLPLGLKFW
ncbi:YisL family protein [Rummeliibacillus pycnus]|uniref:YisL family protein n=1 Tax=Rummeliibacillus pycnus TaxID=101070 RepID=UPI003D27C13C